MFHYLFKTVHIASGKTYWGIHSTYDLLADVPRNYTKYWPQSPLVWDDRDKYGDNAFHHGPYEAFGTMEQAVARQEKEINALPPKLRYNRPSCAGPKSDEMRAKISESAQEWTFINDGKQTRKVLKSEPLPDGWSVGNLNLLRKSPNPSHTDPVKVAATKAANKAKRNGSGHATNVATSKDLDQSDV